jgi:hypothetical protein
MKKLAAVMLVLIGIVLVSFSLALTSGPSDSEIRDRVVKIVGPHGQCSGEQIQAPSGKSYILTAAHCLPIAVEGSMDVITEDGVHTLRKVIAEDSKADLLLVEGLVDRTGLKIANNNYRFQSVRTFTHGRGMDTYTTEGVLVMDKREMVLMGFAADAAECHIDMPKYRAIPSEGGVACVMDLDWTVTTAFVAPGSSGGLVVNSEGEMVGLVSAGGEGFGLLTRLEDIQRFLAKD